ncbi:ABC transporter permease [Amycolatopsis magusensis]|uniref:ABC transporter permease n=1 Tax=Amycolatopsis magusensis TaxID=882444 RepID=UPI003C2B3334
MRKLILAGLRAHKRRLAFAVLATLIGTAFVAGTLVLSDTLRTSSDRLVIGNAANVDVAVVATNQLDKLDREALDSISRLPGVESAQGDVSGDVTLLGQDGRPSREQPVGFSVTMRTNITQGRAPATDDEAVLAEQTAAKAGYAIGDSFTVLDKDSGAKRELRVTGIAGVSGQGVLALRGGIGFTEPVARATTGEENFSEIYVRGANPDGLRQQIAQTLGNGPHQVLSGKQFAEEQASGSGLDPAVLRAGLLMFGLVTLLVAMFVIYNTFNILVAQRTRELALSRCVGASRRQVFAGVLAESAAVGLVASIAGVILGIGVAYLALPVMESMGTGISPDAFTVTPLTGVASVVAGLLATVVAAFVPARGATRVPPIAALRIQSEPRIAGIGRTRSVVAVVLCLAGAASAVGGLVSDARQVPLMLVGLGGVLFFAGVVALGPVLVRLLTRVIAIPVRWAFGVPGRLAVANAIRNPKRASITALALIIGITLTTGVSVITRSLESSVDVGVGRAIPVDYMITPPGTNVNETIPRSVGAGLQSHREVSSLVQVREATVGVGGKDAMLSTIVGADPAVVKGTLEGMGSGEVALRPERATELDADVGSEVAVSTGGKQIVLTVVALVSGDTVPRMYLSPPTFEELFPGRGDTSLLVKFADDVSQDASRAIVDQATAVVPTARIVATHDAKERLTNTLNQVTTVVTGLLALALLISLVGIANTMTLSVLERSRESAMLRALGLGKRGLRRMLATEALIFGLIGGVIGAVLGTAFGLAAARVINDNIQLSVPYERIGIIILGAAVAGLLAALLPIRRATKTSVVASLAGD